MLYYDRIDVSEGIDVNKTSVSKDTQAYQVYQISPLVFLKL